MKSKKLHILGEKDLIGQWGKVSEWVDMTKPVERACFNISSVIKRWSLYDYIHEINQKRPK